MKNKIMNLAVAMLSLAFLLTGCSEEDFPQPQQSGAAGTLHIASISIDGQQVKSRAVADDGNQYDFDEYAYNQSLNSFDEDGDELVVEYRFGDGNAQVAFINYKDGNWSFTEASLSETGSELTNTGTPITIVPGEGKKWKDFVMAIGSNVDKLISPDTYLDVAIVQGNFDKENIRLAADWLYAYSEDGSLTVDTDIKSPTLGAVSATLKHGFRSLLRLPKSAISIDAPNTYLVNGQNYSVTGLATLWAVMTNEGGTYTFYYPLTQVGSNLQSIISLQDCPYLTGFKAVLYTTESGQPGDAGYDATKVLTLDLPLKAGTETSIRLEENYMYPLTLNISPNSSSVTLSGDGLGKPGWGEDEDETTLDNGLNEAQNELSYASGSDNNAGTFSVSGPYGLMLLNMWMTGTLDTDAFVATGFSGATDITDAINPLAQNITITDDITLPNYDGKSNWTRLGNADKPYTGTIDGGNYTLTGLLIRGYATFQGFVGYLGEGGKVKNLTFKDAKVLAFYDCVGIVAGQNRGIVENCHTTGNSLINIFEYIDDVICYVGGIVGFNDGMISACINNAEINADGITRIGGVVGLSSQNDVVIACGNTAMVNDEKYSGGIVGENSGTVTASWTQTTNEKNHLGEKPTEERKNGVGYETNESIITACHVFSQASSVTAADITTMNIAIAAWNATNSSKAVEYGWKAATTSGQWPSLALITELSDSWPVKEGGFYKIGTDYYTAAGVKVESHGVLFTDGTDYYTAAGKKLESHGVLFTDGTDYYTAAGKKLESLADFYTDGTDYYTAAGVKVEGFALTDGTATVSTANALLLWNALAQTDLTLNLTLTADITLPEPAEGGSNWTPVGTDVSNPYTGTIDGGGKTLTGMVINSTEHNQGFVGNLDEGGKVQNLTFADATVISSSASSIGIVAGINMGTVENCHTIGKVEGEYSSIGGIVGENGLNAIITNCTNAATMEGEEVSAGGIAGINWGLVSACINSGELSVTFTENGNIHLPDSPNDYSGVGGIVGDNYGDVIACGNTGTVNGKYNSGGIVGRHDGGSVIASWTQDTNETDNDGNAPSSTENGVGNEASGCIITDCYVFGSASLVTQESITVMNAAIETYNSTASVKCLYRWEPATGGYPTLKTVTE